MALEIKLKLDYASPQYCVAGYIVSHPEPGTEFVVNSLRAVLRGRSTLNRDAPRNMDGNEDQDSLVFLQRSVEIYRPEVFDLPQPMYEGRHSLVYVAFPKDATLQHTREKLWSFLHHVDEILPPTLPPSGRFGPESQIVYSLDASMVDINTGREITASKEIQFSPVRDISEAKAVGVTINQGCFVISSPVVLVPGQAFPLSISISPSYPDKVSQSIEQGVLRFLEYTSSQSAETSSQTWTDEHDVIFKESASSMSDDLENELSSSPQGSGVSKILYHPRVPSKLQS